MRFYVAPTEGSLQTLRDIMRCLDEGQVGTESWPGCLWLWCRAEDAPTIRELIRENGLTIVREEV